MNDLTGKLIDLLSNKENISNIKNLSNIINSSMDSLEKNSSTKKEVSEQTSQDEILPIEAMQTIIKLMPILSSINKEDDNTRLLSALRPYLSAKRQIKLNESIKMMQMFKILPILKNQGIF